MIIVDKRNNKYLLEMLNVCEKYLRGKNNTLSFKNTSFKKNFDFYNIEIGNNLSS